ncbi:hypothetical protein C454_04422 [Haloferax gibbonsii ATCC 33959]|uniref:Uncharacterized protein n=1 Tax=Haloferax gibbonsii (strain ATCC 33959 / DSM 4427 / JCM 8863 / NBRC 102184 / NCIMB 2188 / Ma 2.38) TaxID=1227459 RepID=M0HID2_HALGM|nr:hypothetical protein [Haloferax gibbonsii]ELZ83528.1 hypothetical protein C454_04422 [Haloferax gibbonsii ATCC 33959]
MTLARRLFLLVGVVATAAGFAVVAGVSLGLELTDIFLGLVAALAALQGLRYVQRRRETPMNTTVTGDPEARVAVPIPGSDFDDDLVSAMGRHTHWAARKRVVDRLEARATQALVARDGRAPEEAAALLDTGGWTDDPVAARFLGASVSIPLRQRVRLFLSGQSSLTDRAGRTVAAIERIGTDDGPAGERR